MFTIKVTEVSIQAVVIVKKNTRKTTKMEEFY